MKPRVVAALDGLGLTVTPTSAAVPWVILPASAAPVLAARRLVAKEVPVRAGEGLLRLSVPLSEARLKAFTEATSVTG